MRRDWKNPWLRRLLLQATLCAVLVGTLALARAVRNHKARLYRVPLAAVAREFGPLLMRPPLGWTAQNAADGITLVEGLPADADRPPRRLRVWLAPATTFVSPLDHLVLAGELSDRDAARIAEAARSGLRGALRAVRVGEWPGVLVSQTRLIRSGAGATSAFKQTLACALLPTGQALLMRLEGHGVVEEADELLVRRVAESLAVLPKVSARHGGKVELEHGLAVEVPAALRWAPVADPFRSGQVLLGAGPADADLWLGVELAACLLPTGGEAEALASMMLARDPRSRPGPVVRVDRQTWRCARHAPGPLATASGPSAAAAPPTTPTPTPAPAPPTKKPTPSKAPATATSPASTPATAVVRHAGPVNGTVFLRTLGDGRALLAEFRWAAGDAGAEVEAARAVASLWAALAEGLDAREEGPDVGALLGEGSAARAMVLDPRRLAELVPRLEVVEDWQWYHESAPATTAARWTWGARGGAAGRVGGELMAEACPPLSGSGMEYARWALSPRGQGEYQAIVTRAGSGGGGGGGAATAAAGAVGGAVLSLRAELRGTILSARVTDGRVPVASARSMVGPWYFPGMLLPRVLGRLPYRPMLVQVECLPSETGWAAATPVTVLLEPAFDQPRYPAEGLEPMRCWRVEVSGTGRSSRWYVDEEGRLAAVAFPSGVRLHRLDPAPSSVGNLPDTRPAGRAGWRRVLDWVRWGLSPVPGKQEKGAAPQ